VHAARLKLATSVPALSDVAVAQSQLPQDPRRALLDRGRVGRIEKIGIRSQPSRSQRPIAKNQTSYGELLTTRRRLFPEVPSTQRGEFKAITDFASVGVRPTLGMAQTSSNAAPNILPLAWINNEQNIETAGMIKRALEIADRAQDTSSQNHEVIQLVQQSVRMNFKMSPPKAPMLGEQRLQLEWEAMRLNQQKNELELAAYQQGLMLNQRAVEVANMEQLSRHQAIEIILHVEYQAQHYVQHYELEAEKQKQQSLVQESLVATIKSEYAQQGEIHRNIEHALAEQKNRNLEIEAIAQQAVDQQQLHIAKLAQSMLLHQSENEVAQGAVEDAMLREQQLVAYNEASAQQQQEQQEMLFNEVLVERGQQEAHCQQLATK